MKVMDSFAGQGANRSHSRAMARLSPDMNSPCGLFMPGEEAELREVAACKACNAAVRAKTRFHVPILPG